MYTNGKSSEKRGLYCEVDNNQAMIRSPWSCHWMSVNVQLRRQLQAMSGLQMKTLPPLQQYLQKTMVECWLVDGWLVFNGSFSTQTLFSVIITSYTNRYLSYTVV